MRWTVLAAGLLAVLFVEPAAADTRVALVVGNSTYQNVSRLQNPKSDAELVAETLQRLGFALVGGQAQVDLDKTGFDAAIQRFTVQKPGLDVLQAFNQVGLVVKRATGSAQQPWVSTSPIDGSFYFAGNTPAQVATADPPATVIPPPPSSPPSAPPVVRTQSDFIIIPDSDSRLLSESDLRALSKDDLRIARNEIFARRGRYFNAPDLTARFSRFAWYVPRSWDPPLNAIESANVALIDQAGKP